MVCVENQARDLTQLLGAQSGCLLRPRRGDACPSGSWPTSDCIVMMGSNMAENHPVAFRFVHAGEGAGRDRHPRRPALHPHLGAGRHPRAAPRRHATSPSSAASSATCWRTTCGSASTRCTTPTSPTIIEPGFQDTERAGRRVLRLRTPTKRALPHRHLAVRGHDGAVRRWPSTTSTRPQIFDDDAQAAERGPAAERPDAAAPELRLPDRQAPLRRATRRRWSSGSTGCPPSVFLKVCEAMTRNSGRERTGAFCYAVGWTHHTHRRADDPRCGASSRCCSATSGGPAAASWRCAAMPPSRAAPTSRRSTTCCPATCRSRTRRRPQHDLRELPGGRDGADRLVAQLPEVHGQPAQGLVRRRRDAGQRVGLSSCCRRSSATIRSCR